MFWNKYKSFIFILLATYLISVPAGFITSNNVLSWYADITRPSFSPPNWVFGPVWSFLYAIMSVAVWNVWNNTKEINKSLGIKILSIYFIHLLVGASWSFVFFWFAPNIVRCCCDCDDYFFYSLSNEIVLADI